MKRMLAMALLFVLAAAAAQAVGKADPPVRITACGTSSNPMDSYGVPFHPQPWTWAADRQYTLMYSDSGTHDPAYMPGIPNLAVDYVNQTASVIRSIEFGVETRGHLLGEIRDEGTFSPATQISHGFRIPNGWIGSGSLTCVPLSVTFANGTTWNSPAPR